MSTESKVHLMKRLDEEWPKFRQLLESIPEAEMEEPGVIDQWSIKELLGHAIFWARKGATDLRLTRSGRTDDIQLPGGQARVDEWNASAAANGRDRSKAELLAELQAAHDDAREAAQEVHDEGLAIELSGWTVGVRFAEDTYRHYREHAEQIRAWQRQLETTEA
ncbi:MAG TPA: maleylpyruvate isomerase N-terminal domain-containing protein [Dehalococcoidia bacterium]|nr:maleylpyruvate isomerase N-terminal domain-containing protein [Dehalococcoidia bacterium]